MIVGDLKRRWPLWGILVGLWVAVILFLVAMIHRNAGVFTYILDDAYIHLAIAKHFVQDGVWGATRYGFSASTSSPGWTLLLSGIIVLFGHPEVWPLILNVLFATALLIVIDRLIVSSLPNPFPRFLVLLFITLIAPLPVLIFSGMEHVLHVLLIAMLFSLLRRYEAATADRSRTLIGLFVVVALSTSVRYETGFLTGPLAVYYVWRRDWRVAFGLVGATAISPIAIGVVQLSHGWYFLPNSILAKGVSVATSGVWESLFDRFLYNLPRSATLYIMALIIVLLALIRFRNGRWRDASAIWTASFLIATTFQYTVAQVGWLYRYESYLIVFGCLVVLTGDFFPAVRTWFQSLHSNGRLIAAAGLTTVAIVAAPIFGFRLICAEQDILLAAKVMYTEYYPMARFIARYYPDAPVVINDLGLISYLTDAHVVDLFALANREPLLAQLTNTFDTTFIDRWTQSQGAQLAVIHDLFYQGNHRLPASWIRVGGWTVYNEFYEMDSVISIYSVSPSSPKMLSDRFQAFVSSLPNTTHPMMLHFEP